MATNLLRRLRKFGMQNATSVMKEYSGLALQNMKSDGRKDMLDQVQANQMVLYRDDDVIGLNKPAGLAVHGGPRLKHDLSQYMHFWKYEQTQQPQLSHRLDKDTSGVLLLTRHKEAARWIAELYYKRKIIKKYWALTVSVPGELKGSIKSRLAVRNIATSKGSHSMNRVVMSTGWGDEETSETTSSKKLAWTDYKVLSVPKAAPHKCCLMQLQAITGYKHQLRVHLADGLLCPVFGDHKFGGPLFRSDQSLRRKVQSMQLNNHHLHLHAISIAIPGYHGEGKPPLVIQAPLPDYYTAAIETLKLTKISN